MSKDMWFAEMERLLSEKEDAGIPFDRAYEEAGNEAHGALVDRLADMVDQMRRRAKDEPATRTSSEASTSISTTPNKAGA